MRLPIRTRASSDDMSAISQDSGSVGSSHEQQQPLLMMMMMTSSDVHSAAGSSSAGGGSSQQQQLQIDATVASMASALSEMQCELREKTTECEALYETANALSRALRESDTLLERERKKNERLQMKLSMLCFHEVEQEDDEDDEEEELKKKTKSTPDYYPEEDPLSALLLERVKIFTAKNRAASRRRSSNNSKKLGERIVVDADHQEDDTVSTTSIDSDFDADDVAPLPPPRRRFNTSPIRRKNVVGLATFPKEGQEEEEEDGEEYPQESTITPPPASTSVPSQAHFYQIILERDVAQKTSKKLDKELKRAKAEIKSLKSRLDLSTALVEISYADKGDEEKKEQQHQQHQQEHSKASQDDSKHRRGWLKRIGSARRDHNNNMDPMDEFEFPEEETKAEVALTNQQPKKVTTTTTTTTLPTDFPDEDEEYMKAIAGLCDADTAGGLENVRVGI